jgi:ADP-ribosylglycohydrolase
MSKILIIKRILEGIACGDALGKITSKYSKEEVLKIYGGPIKGLVKPIRIGSKRNWERGDITDDTLLTLLVADSLIKSMGFSRRDIGRRLLSCPDTRGGKQIIKLIESGNPDFVAQDGNTNGSSIRIAPISIVFAENENLYDYLLQQSTLTHAGKEALVGSLILGHVYSQIILGKTREEIREKLAIDSKEIVSKYLFSEEAITLKNLGLALNIANNCSKSNLCDKIEKMIGMNKQAYSSIVAGIVIGLYGQNTRKLLIDISNRKFSGGDLDSVGAIVGAINYPFNEHESLKDWVKIIEERNKFSLEDYAKQLEVLRKNDKINCF